MMRSARWLPVASALVAAAWLCQSTAHAQYFYRNNNPYLVANLQMMRMNNYTQQLMNNQQAQVFNQAYGGFYPTPYSPNFPMQPIYPNAYYPQVNPYYPPVSTPYVNPYIGTPGNPYMPNVPGYNPGGNPYVPNPVDPYVNPYNPYNPYSSPGYGAGQVLYGQADNARAYGQVINAQEQARILREQALQAQLETKKKKFDLDMYIKANTPTYTQEQERTARNTLKRIQTNSLPGEVVTGKSLNYLLDDLSKYPKKKIALEPIQLSDGVLTRLSVTKKTYGMGLLRDGGRFTWPTALQDQVTAKHRQDLDKQIRAIVDDAYRGKLDANALKDVTNEMKKIRNELVDRVNEVPSGQYLAAKRFLSDFDDAVRAMGNGEAKEQAAYQRFVEGGKSVQEVADYLLERGLRIAPASLDDEAAYRAIHAALATYDVAMNSQAGTGDN